MSKQDLMSQITTQINQLKIPYQLGPEADIIVVTEFLNAGWSTGNKKISYEATVFADEASRTVFMWEMTKEVGHGLSFGADSGSSFQTGTTLFRKVKSIQYGPEGQVYEYTLNLGAIPKAVKEAAKQYGWKFKTVLSKNKAQYPAGYTPAYTPSSTQQIYQTGLGQAETGEAQQPEVTQTEMNQAAPIQIEHTGAEETAGYCSNCGMPYGPGAAFCNKCGKPTERATTESSTPSVPSTPMPTAVPVTQPSYSDPQGPFYAQSQASASGQEKVKVGVVAYILLGLVTFVFFAVGGVSFGGWVLGVLTIGGFAYLQNKRGNKECFLSIVMWCVALFILFMILGLAS